MRRRGFEPVSWDDALDTAEELLRAAHGRVVVALSGSETIEQAYALAKLVRQGADSHDAVLPEEVSGALDAYRSAALRDRQGTGRRGPWRRAARAKARRSSTSGCVKARRNGARIVTSEEEAKDAERIVLIWSGPGGRAGVRVAQLAEKLGLAGKEGCGAFFVPATPNGRGVADAWAAASDSEPGDADSIGLLIVSGDEAAGDPNVRGLAEHAEAVIAISMFHGLAVGWADLVLPGTSYLERDGTYVNIEGRLQRLRRTAAPPGPDELEWLAELASRFGVTLTPYAAPVFAEVSERCYGGLSVRRDRRAALLCAPTRERPLTPTSPPCPSRPSQARACGSSATSRSSRDPPSSGSRSCSSSGRRPRSSLRLPTPGASASRRATRSPCRVAVPP